MAAPHEGVKIDPAAALVLFHNDLQEERETRVCHDLRHIDALLRQRNAKVRVELGSDLDDDLAGEGVAGAVLDRESEIVVLARLVDAVEVPHRRWHTEDPVVRKRDSWVTV